MEHTIEQLRAFALEALKEAYPLVGNSDEGAPLPGGRRRSANNRQNGCTDDAQRLPTDR